MEKITIIGGGNMGGAIAKGIVRAGLAKTRQITLTRRSAEALRSWAESGYAVSTSNIDAVSGADVVIFAVKPYQIEQVAQAIRDAIAPGTLCISIATGVTLAQLVAMLGDNKSIVRAMPNTAAEVGESVTALCCASQTTTEALSLSESIFNSLGKTFVIDEEQMPALTALASCGIAHALRYIRAAQESAIEMGINAAMAAEIVAQTVKGAAQLILTNRSHPEVEIDKVCTPKGVTIAGINAMEHAGFTSAVMRGMMGSYDKIMKK